MSAVADSSPMVVHASAMITGAQIRAGRALLGWTSQHLADVAHVSYASVSRAERSDGVPGLRATSLAAIQEALEGAGVIFQRAGETPNGGPGVRLKG